MSEKPPVRPWDLFSAKKLKLTPEGARARFEVCLSCEHLIQLTKTCKKCGCFMELKTKLQDAVCPVGKW